MRDVSEWWWKVAHDARNSGMGEDLNFLEMKDGTNGLGGCFGDCEMRADLGQCGEFVYVRGS